MKITLILITIVLYMGCAGLNTNNLVDVDNLPVYPSPPDQPRIQYLRSISSSSDISPATGFDQYLFGRSLLELEVGIEKPYGVAFRNGKVYICDTMLPGLVILDLQEKIMRTFRPLGRGILRKPINVVIDTNGDIYVTDTERQQVVVYSEDLDYKYALTSKSWKPIDIAILGDSLLVTDYLDKNIEVWSKKSKKYIGEFPPNNVELPDSQRVFVPYAVTVNQNGHIYISDFGQFRIQEFDRRGNYIRSFGGIGTNIGNFARPKGIAVDQDSVLYVVDSAFENVQLFDSKGRLLMFFGGSYQGIGDMYLPAQVIVDNTGSQYFTDYVLPGYKLGEIIIVTNQYGPDKISFYGKITPINPSAVEGE